MAHAALLLLQTTAVFVRTRMLRLEGVAGPTGHGWNPEHNRCVTPWDATGLASHEQSCPADISI